MDNSRLFLFAALVFVGMLLYQQWQADYGPKPASVSQTQTAEAVDGQAAIEIDDLPEQADSVTSSAVDATASSNLQETQAAEARQLLRIDTDVVQARTQVLVNRFELNRVRNQPAETPVAALPAGVEAYGFVYARSS